MDKLTYTLSDFPGVHLNHAPQTRCTWSLSNYFSPAFTKKIIKNVGIYELNVRKHIIQQFKNI